MLTWDGAIREFPLRKPRFYIEIGRIDDQATSAGGFYSTPNDLMTLGTAILNNSMLGSGATSKWLKPVSSTSTVGRDMGAPWEILRSANLVSGHQGIEVSKRYN